MKKLDAQQVQAIVKFQKRFKGFLVRKHFFKALSMNRYLEHKRNFIKLKKCLEEFDRKQEELASAKNPIISFFNS